MATAVSAVLGLLQVVLIPKLLTVNTFGAFRIFVLYAGYAGILHFGVADGAFLHWAGRPFRTIAREWKHVTRWVAITGVALSCLFATIGAFLWHSLAGHVLIAVSLAAPLINTLTLAGYALQAGREFRLAGVLSILPQTVFLIGVWVLAPDARTFGGVGAVYVLGQLAGVFFGVIVLLEQTSPECSTVDRPPLTSLVSIGGPVMVANFAAGLSITVDRIILTWLMPIAQFALYAFAASWFFVVNLYAQSLARVALPHVSQGDDSRRTEVFTQVYELIQLSSGAVFALYPFLEAVIRSWLPQYGGSAWIMRALLPGAFFWLASQSVQMTALRVWRKGRIQVALSLVSVFLTGIAVWTTASAKLPLWMVGASASVSMLIAWVLGEFAVIRALSASAPRGGLQYAATQCLQLGAMTAALSVTNSPAAQVSISAGLGLIPTILLIRSRSHPGGRGTWVAS